MIYYNPVQRILVSSGGVGGSAVWQDPVLDAGVTTLPGSPSTGDRYVLSDTHPTNPDEIAEWNGTNWDYTVPLDGYTLWTIATDEMLTFNGTAWVVISGSGTGNHNSLFGLQGGTTNEYYHLTAAQYSGLTGGGDTTLHYHAADRDRANHTGTQLAATISDFQASVSANTDVAANTVHRTSDGSDHSLVNETADSVVNGLIEPTGFPSRSDNTISFVDATRTFTIAPTGASFDIYEKGTKYTISAADSVVVSTSLGLNVIYYDEGTLSVLFDPSPSQRDIVIRYKPLVAYVYWDGTEGIYIGDERHGCQMDGATHSYLHFIEGTRWGEGLTPSTLTATDGDGDVDASAQIALTNGAIVDEDIYFVITDNGPEDLTPILKCPVWYIVGTHWQTDAPTDFPVKRFGPTARLAYNDVTAGTQVEVPNNDFVLCHIFATNNTLYPVVAFQGQASYTTLGNARLGANNELLNLSGADLVFEETKPIATFIYQTSNSSTNAVKARIRSTETGDDWVDWRFSNISGAPGTNTNHSLLINLASDDHLQYPMLIGRATGQTLYGSNLTAEDLTLGDNTVDGNTITVTQLIASRTHVTSNGSDHLFINQDVQTTASPQFAGLAVAADTDTEIILGRAKLNGPFADYATFAHYDANTTTAYALATNGSNTLVNAPSNVYLSIGGQYRVNVTNTGARIKTAGHAILAVDAAAGAYESRIEFQQNNVNGGWIYFDHATDDMEFQCSGGAWFSHDVNVGDDLYVTDTIVAGGLLAANTHLRLKQVAAPTAAAGYGFLYTKTDDVLYFMDAAGTEHDLLGGGGGAGDVVGPASSLDHYLAAFDGTTGKLLEQAPAKIDSTGHLTLFGTSAQILVGANYWLRQDNAGAGFEFKEIYNVWYWNGNTFIFNDDQRDFDFRIESDISANAMFLRGSDGSVGFGTNTLGGLMTVRRDNPTNETTLNLQNYNNNQQTTNNMLKMQIGNTTGLDANPYFFNCLNGNSITTFSVKGDGRTCCGPGTASLYADLTLARGALCMAETTTPTADTNFGKIYCKADNSLYFQDGAGTEHTVALGAVGKVVQRVTTVFTSVTTGTTVFPIDNTTPQNTEGTEWMTRSITPTSSTNILEIEVEFWWSTNVVNGMGAAIFQDTAVNAISSGSDSPEQSYSMSHIFHLKHRMAAGTTSSTTFKFRSGQSAAHTMTMNGVGGLGWFNGTMQSRMTITEYAV